MNVFYSYDPYKDNVNFRAIEGFSVYADQLMAECTGNCPYPTFDLYARYYGLADYGDHIISAAFKGESTFLKNGNMDFSVFGDDGREAFLLRAMVNLNVWMWVTRHMNFAIDICEGKTDCPFEDQQCTFF
jgi:hypothetical protein